MGATNPHTSASVWTFSSLKVKEHQWSWTWTAKGTCLFRCPPGPHGIFMTVANRLTLTWTSQVFVKGMKEKYLKKKYIFLNFFLEVYFLLWLFWQIISKCNAEKGDTCTVQKARGLIQVKQRQMCWITSTFVSLLSPIMQNQRCISSNIYSTISSNLQIF